MFISVQTVRFLCIKSVKTRLISRKIHPSRFRQNVKSYLVICSGSDLGAGRGCLVSRARSTLALALSCYANLSLCILCSASSLRNHIRRLISLSSEIIAFHAHMGTAACSGAETIHYRFQNVVCTIIKRLLFAVALLRARYGAGEAPTTPIIIFSATLFIASKHNCRDIKTPLITCPPCACIPVD